MIIKQLKNRIIEQAFVLAGHEFDTSGIGLGEPRNKKFGDLATNAAMVLAPVIKDSPEKIAKKLIDSAFSKWEEIEKVEIAKPGFINFCLKESFIQASMKNIIKEGGLYGTNDTGRGVKVNAEYVSANPTGDLHIGHGRWAVLGDVLSRIYSANGYEITREYYVNDYGTQIRKFTDCIKAIYLEKTGYPCPYPKEAYPRETAEAVVQVMEKDSSFKKKFKGRDEIERQIDSFERAAVGVMLEKIKSTLIGLGVEFDVWFDESSLYEGDNFDSVVERLKSKRLVYEKEGALWFSSSKYGDDKDRVIIRKVGEPTYFASDIMYLMDKDSRGFDRLIYILGADHHGYVDRLKAIGQAIGLDQKDIKIIIGQLVRLVRSGKALKMSKRKGQVYSLKELLEEVGKDPVRYFFAANSFDTPMDFDIDLAKQRSNKNPVFYVQYAHARIESIIDNVITLGLSGQDLKPEDLDGLALDSEEEIGLAKALMFYPDVVYDSCYSDSPHFITQYVYELASRFHHFYNHYRIIDGHELKTDRFKLALLVKIVLKNALGLLGIDAPKKM